MNFKEYREIASFEGSIVQVVSLHEEIKNNITSVMHLIKLVKESPRYKDLDAEVKTSFEEAAKKIENYDKS